LYSFSAGAEEVAGGNAGTVFALAGKGIGTRVFFGCSPTLPLSSGFTGSESLPGLTGGSDLLLLMLVLLLPSLAELELLLLSTDDRLAFLRGNGGGRCSELGRSETRPWVMEL
jgi:hypothetical protein